MNEYEQNTKKLSLLFNISKEEIKAKIGKIIIEHKKRNYNIDEITIINKITLSIQPKGNRLNIDTFIKEIQQQIYDLLYYLEIFKKTYEELSPLQLYEIFNLCIQALDELLFLIQQKM